ncbi:MAG: fasciclin domain-containing protein [Chitinophagaceae bacterium]|nr:fasciclin domain-containing protein [Chitinophagaceae bacterium]
MKSSFIISLAILLLAACSKDKSNPGNAHQNNGIVQVAYNNFSLYLYYTALTSTGYGDTLNGTGPYTVLGPSNSAFQAAGLNSGTDIIRAADSMRTMMPYLVLKQRLAIDSTPLAFDQELTAANGKKIYLTHWINKRDTAVVVNGIRINTLSKPASNGLVNIADGLIYPSVFSDVQTAVSGNPGLTLFNAALMQSGVYNDLRTGGPYTVFAPVNTAFNTIGITTTDSIYKMDPARLKTLVLAHVAPVRSFVYDYILKADETTNTYTETAMDGSTLTVTLLPNTTQPGRFRGITLTPNGGPVVGLTRSNILADNGVVHSINTLLKTNF